MDSDCGLGCTRCVLQCRHTLYFVVNVRITPMCLQRKGPFVPFIVMKSYTGVKVYLHTLLTLVAERGE
jgi:hypothetical protein